MNSVPSNEATATPSPTLAGLRIPEQILFGNSDAMQMVRHILGKVASTAVPLLIAGESGTGREEIARYVHSCSRGHDAPFVRVNCPGIPGGLIESELFGYEKGAYSGASAGRIGLVEAASGGTLFLDGIDELELSLQSKLLQFLQDGEISRIGGQVNRNAQVRVICSASSTLDDEINAGQFRQDLFYRINVVTVQLPPLRRRRMDIPDLIGYLLSEASREFDREPAPIRPQVMDLLLAHDWPGNIRQLENIIRRFVILGSEVAIMGEICGTSAEIKLRGESASLASLQQITRSATKELERKVILNTLSANHWNRKRTAQALRLSYRSLLYKMKSNGLLSKRSSQPVCGSAVVADQTQDPEHN